MNRTFKSKQQKIQMLITSTLLSPIVTKFLQVNRSSGGRGIPRLPHKMVNGGHIEFCQMLISPYCPRDQIYSRQLICMTSSVELMEQMWVVLGDCRRHLNQIWYRAQETDNHCGGMCQIHLS